MIPGIAKPQDSYRKRNKLDYPVNVARFDFKQLTCWLFNMLQECSSGNSRHTFCVPFRYWALPQVGHSLVRVVWLYIQSMSVFCLLIYKPNWPISQLLWQPPLPQPEPDLLFPGHDQEEWSWAAGEKVPHLLWIPYNFCSVSPPHLSLISSSLFYHTHWSPQPPSVCKLHLWDRDWSWPAWD